MPAAAASRMAADAAFGGTATNEAVAPVAATASATVSKIGMPSTSWPPLPGVTPADDLRAVRPVAQAVEPALAAGEALDDHLGVLVDEDRHVELLGVGAVGGDGGRRLARASSIVGLEMQLVLGDAGVGRIAPALLGVRAVEADHDRRPELDPAERLDDAVGHLVAAW